MVVTELVITVTELVVAELAVTVSELVVAELVVTVTELVVGERMVTMAELMAKVYVVRKGQELQPWFQAKPIVVYLGYSHAHGSQTAKKFPGKHCQRLEELMFGGDPSESSPLEHKEKIFTCIPASTSSSARSPWTSACGGRAGDHGDRAGGRRAGGHLDRAGGHGDRAAGGRPDGIGDRAGGGRIIILHIA